MTDLEKQVFQNTVDIEALQKFVDYKPPDKPPIDPPVGAPKAVEVLVFEQTEVGVKSVNVQIGKFENVDAVVYEFWQGSTRVGISNGGVPIPLKPRDLENDQTTKFPFPLPDASFMSLLTMRVIASNKDSVLKPVSEAKVILHAAEPPDVIDPPDKPNPDDYDYVVQGLEGLSKLNNISEKSRILVKKIQNEKITRSLIIDQFVNCLVEAEEGQRMTGEHLANGQDIKVWFENNQRTKFLGFEAYMMPHDAFVLRGNIECQFKLKSTYSWLSGVRTEGGNVSNKLELICTDARQSHGNGDSDADGVSLSHPTDADNEVHDSVFEYNADDGGDAWLSKDTRFVRTVSRNNGMNRNGQRLGNGNGFKLGGRNQGGTASCFDCEASHNLANGFDTNTGTGAHEIVRCFGEGNRGNLYAIYNKGKVIDPR